MNGSIFKRDDSPFYYFVVTAGGKRWRGSTGQQEKPLAQLYLEQKMKNLEGQAGVTRQRRAVGLTVNSILDTLEETMALKKLRSLRVAKCQIEHLRQALGECSPAMVDATAVREYQRIRLKVAKPRTVDVELEHLARAFRLSDLKPPKIEVLVRGNANARQGYAEPKLIDKFVKEARKADAGFGLFCEYIFRVGRRVGEVSAYLKTDVSGDMLRIRPEITKTKLDDFPLDGRILEIVQEAMKLPGPLLFTLNGKRIGSNAGGLSTTATRLWKKIAASVGAPDLLPHDSRRSASRNLTRAGVSPLVVMSITGHQTDSMFRRYNITSEQDRRSAMRL